MPRGGHVCGLYPELCCPNRARTKAVKWPMHSTLFHPLLSQIFRKCWGHKGDIIQRSPSPSASLGWDGSNNGLTDKWEALKSRLSFAHA